MKRLTSALPPPLPGPFSAPPAAEVLRPSAATLNLVRNQVRALLLSSPAFHALVHDDRQKLAQNLVKIAAYAAELIRDDWYQSGRLGQRPLLREKRVIAPLVAKAQSAGDEFKPAAANQIARVTQETLRAIAFPTFVADLIKGTFNAIVQSSIHQMEAYMQLLVNVAKTVDQFTNGSISDNQARDWLAQMYPEHIVVQPEGQGARAVPRPGAEDRPAPNWQSDLNLSDEVSLDEDSIEEKLVPAARRKLAQNRLQMLSTMVLMGINRIVVTGGKIRATMGFHIDTVDRMHEEHATDFDLRHSASGRYGFGPWSASASLSIAYVRSTRADSDAELNVEADLTGEVELHFKSDYFPVQRFADANAIGRIQANTAVPEANTALSASGEPIQWGSSMPPQQPRQSTPRRTTLPPLRTAASEPVRPAPPEPVQRPPEQREETPREETETTTPETETSGAGTSGTTTEGATGTNQQASEPQPAETANQTVTVPARENGETRGQRTGETVGGTSGETIGEAIGGETGKTIGGAIGKGLGKTVGGAIGK